MKLRTTLPLLLLLLSIAPLSAQKKYTYTSVPGDPMETRIYTLDNGLQVWLSRNTDAPRVQTNIAVRAGSKNDPTDATGLAHYLEHMLFKGTSHIGTRDWAKESVLLKQISDAYEERRGVTDEAKRTAIYERMIDDMDINCGDVLDGVSLEAKGQEIFETILRVASGERSKSEQLGYGDAEFVPWTIGATM